MPTSPGSLSSSPPFVNTHMASFTPHEIMEWERRSDVLYHFHAYRYFSQSFPDTSIDLINLDDADVQYYNRTSDMVRGLSISHKLADYLSTFSLKYPVEAANTHRKRFLCHVREYNMRSESRRRLYMVGLSEEEVEFLKSLPTLQDLKSKASPATGVEVGEAESAASDVKENIKDCIVSIGSVAEATTAAATKAVNIAVPRINPNSSTFIRKRQVKSLGWATDGCPDIHPQSHDELDEQEVKVKQLIEDCLKKYREKSASSEVALGVEQHASALKLGDKEQDAEVAKALILA
ncbi:hypothetical protein BDZ45DRAFT_772355 [Acephala macrosclerotiorum]|nr:hypothetical protein BDZ45DRAFT_772355 [Acephala macrosclerotiorum]